MRQSHSVCCGLGGRCALCAVFPPRSYLIAVCCHYSIPYSVIEFLYGMYVELRTYTYVGTTLQQWDTTL
jgi:hypothetical protein